MAREIYDQHYVSFTSLESALAHRAFTYPPAASTLPNTSHVFKVFLGGLCFELTNRRLQMILWGVCGVYVRLEHIELYSRNGRHIGCGTVYVTSEEDRDKLLDYNRRLLFTPDGVWTGSTPESLSKVVDDVVLRQEGYRGPRHAAVIEPTKLQAF
jgi:hypothetical protein